MGHKEYICDCHDCQVQLANCECEKCLQENDRKAAEIWAARHWDWNANAFECVEQIKEQAENGTYPSPQAMLREWDRRYKTSTVGVEDLADAAGIDNWELEQEQDERK